MKKLLCIGLISIFLFSCNDKEEPAPTATGKYTGTYSGYVSPQNVSGVCTADLVEKDQKVTGTLVFKNFANGDFSFPFTGTISENTLNATFPISGIGDFPCTGTISSDRKKIEMSLNAAPVFNLKWELNKD